MPSHRKTRSWDGMGMAGEFGTAWDDAIASRRMWKVRQPLGLRADGTASGAGKGRDATHARGSNHLLTCPWISLVPG